jgi:hypothetical protein
MGMPTTPTPWNISCWLVSKTYVPITLIHPATQALELGDAVCLFPEGMSRFHPTIAPLKTGGELQVAPILCSSL